LDLGGCLYYDINSVRALEIQCFVEIF
jgi:hypothetical protein